MVRTKKKIFQLLALIVIFMIIMVIPCSGTYDPLEDPNSFRPGNIDSQDTNVITDKVNGIIGTIVTIGVIISVITLCILGIKYMIGSVEERAEYKKTMIPYLVGAILIFGASAITKVVVSIGSGITA